MPRIRIRTSEDERIVGTSNCSVLTIQLVTHAQRHTLQLRADAMLTAGDSVLEHASWEWPELSDTTTVELISEPSSSPYAAYDPPDALHLPQDSVSTEIQRDRSAGPDYIAAQKELREAIERLAGIAGRPVPAAAAPPVDHLKADVNSKYCSFCGKSQSEVHKLVAGPAVYICDECVHLANEMLAD